ncbi:hypothetical protein D2E25_1217 [Bifidobacterium goeldii]|uniref:Uncharacterized protein n=1 Tax=Bifidobacterium goeldii TaxID=2306975 RepID=A0A430FK16_9BIFI|nr:hypothetical protein [Bifidobacterium goeldii]RSX53244.1 hypothetical protein D2E25_1217 [Bifidobacterium goeldii]
MTDKVTSYHQARQIFREATGIEASMEGGEDDEYFSVLPIDFHLQPIDDCAWFVNKKTGKFERRYASPLMPEGFGDNMYYRDFKPVRDVELEGSESENSGDGQQGQ